MELEEELITGCCKKDRKAQRKLYDLYAGQMLVVAMRYVKAQDEAEDILQEAFIKVFKNIETFRKESSLFFWIKKILVNTALNHQRSKLYMYPMVDVDEMRSLQQQETTLSGYRYQELLGFIHRLPDGCRVIFNLFAIEGYGHKEIAKMLNISEGTSKSQYSRARLLLKEMINSEDELRYGTFK
ncbi:RNA polymerase sigma factor [Roseivirga sp. BDSF3-8]|uniref:RNA polymerase sigma factor n=1 Tax=Roseivirga sp. BDSF3-8 TaxID=3241598 RepID=UPI003531B7FB